jgi:broad specificity phosphatase PhoE
MTLERRLLLVRHGETEGNSTVHYLGSTDVALSDLGRCQIRRLVPMVRAFAPAAVVHSPLRRAAESAAILGQGCAWPAGLLQAEPGLREICFGECEGLTGEQIAASFPEFWREHGSGRSQGFPGGETFGGFAARVRAALDRLLRAVTAGDLMVVAHRGVVRQALHHLLGDGAGAQYGVDLGSLTVVRLGPVPVVEDFNRTRR